MYVKQCYYVMYQSMATRKCNNVLVRQAHPVEDISKVWSTLSPIWRSRKINIISNFVGTNFLITVYRQNYTALQIPFVRLQPLFRLQRANICRKIISKIIEQHCTTRYCQWYVVKLPCFASGKRPSSGQTEESWSSMKRYNKKFWHDILLSFRW
jgi:hypothetical protein